MSWLLVAFIPGLLMLATVGLSRLEVGLAGDTVSPDDVTALLEQAKEDSLRRPLPVRDPTPSGVLPLRAARPEWHGGAEAASTLPSTLPTRVYVRQGGNPQFRAYRQADPV